VLEFEILNVPDNGLLWYPGSVSPQSEFSGGAVGWQSDHWDFGDGGLVTFSYRYMPIWYPGAAEAQVLSSAMGQGPYHGPYERGFSATVYCGNSPESWIRGRADLDRASGRLTILMQLETDDVFRGPKGYLEIYVYDGAGGEIARAKTGEIGIDGKKGSYARQENVGGTAQIPAEVARRAQSIKIIPQCTGSTSSFFGISWGDLLQIVELIIKAVAGGGFMSEYKSQIWREDREARQIKGEPERPLGPAEAEREA